MSLGIDYNEVYNKIYLIVSLGIDYSEVYNKINLNVSLCINYNEIYNKIDLIMRSLMDENNKLIIRICYDQNVINLMTFSTLNCCTWLSYSI